MTTAKNKAQELKAIRKLQKKLTGAFHGPKKGEGVQVLFLSGKQNDLSPRQLAEFQATLARHHETQIMLYKMVSESRQSRDRLAVLVKLAMDSTKAVNDIVLANPEWGKEIARKIPHWPVLATSHPKRLKEINNLIKSIPLGANAPVEYKKLRKKDTAARAWAIKAIEAISLRRETEFSPSACALTDEIDFNIFHHLLLTEKDVKVSEQQWRESNIYEEREKASKRTSTPELERGWKRSQQLYDILKEPCHKLPPLNRAFSVKVMIPLGAMP